MPNNASYVSTGMPKTGGAVFTADTSATMPTSVSATLTGFETVGHISEDGWKNSITRESTDIKSWGGETVLTTQTSKSETVSMTFIEVLNLQVQKAVHGASNVSGTLDTGVTITENSKELEEKAWVIDTILNGGYVSRKVIPKGRITEIGEVTYKADEAIGYEVTITALPDSSGNTSYTYIASTGSGGSGATSGATSGAQS